MGGRIMKKKKGSTEESLSRRKAIKRIAAMFAGAYIGTKLGPTKQGPHFAYLSSAPYNPYADSVYASTSPTYSRYISYYTSYRSHYSSVPPPYIPKR